MALLWLNYNPIRCDNWCSRNHKSLTWLISFDLWLRVDILTINKYKKHMSAACQRPILVDWSINSGSYKLITNFSSVSFHSTFTMKQDSGTQSDFDLTFHLLESLVMNTPINRYIDQLVPSIHGMYMQL